MDFITCSHRHAYEIFTVDENIRRLWEEITETLKSISDDDIINEFNSEKRKAKSISEAINKLIARKMASKGWNEQSRIFADPEYSDNKGIWRLDFAKEDVAIEVAFNHGGNVSWNLLKPVLSSELNHVTKAIQTKVGVVITATDEMKNAGGFDGAVGSYEKYVEYLKPLNDILTTPIMIVGLMPPKTFIIRQKNENRKKIGYIEMIERKEDEIL